MIKVFYKKITLIIFLKLSKKTKATLYKFTKGKFKTYFVLGSNCVYLVDNIIGSAWIDILKMNGIITQGIINNNIVANSFV